MEETGTGSSDITFTFGATSGDNEIDAMRIVLIAMRPLNADARQRVVRWAAERYAKLED